MHNSKYLKERSQDSRGFKVPHRKENFGPVITFCCRYRLELISVLIFSDSEVRKQQQLCAIKWSRNFCHYFEGRRLINGASLPVVPTNNALLLNIRLRSDAEIFVNKHQLSIQIGAKRENTCLQCVFIFRLNFLCIPTLLVGSGCSYRARGQSQSHAIRHSQLQYCTDISQGITKTSYRMSQKKIKAFFYSSSFNK